MSKRCAVPSPLQIVPLAGLPAVHPGDDLAGLLEAALAAVAPKVTKRDVLVVCQKVVSKAEGRVVSLADVAPSGFARAYALEHDKDPRLVEVVLRETRRIVRMVGPVLICETHHGLVCANAGVDVSNALEEGSVTLLPVDPDRSARQLRDALSERGIGPPAVIVTDSFGRPWREGQVDVAIGVAGIKPVRELEGTSDWSGQRLRVSAPAIADMLSAAAGLVMVKGGGIPAALVRGFRFQPTRGSAAELRRAPERDLFR